MWGTERELGGGDTKKGETKTTVSALLDTVHTGTRIKAEPC